MNGRKLFREYAQHKGKEAVSFVEIKQEWYSDDKLITLDSNNKTEETTIDYREMINCVIKTKKLQ